MDSILACLWDLELHLGDLDLPAETLKRVMAALSGSDAKQIEDARGTVRAAYLTESKADLSDKPKEARGNSDLYAGGATEVGEPTRGELLFQASCGGCHGGDVAAPKVSQISKRAREDQNFHRIPLRGTERRGALYMPLFTSERMSRRQVADIRAYLRSLQSLTAP
jgi:mono/diheme cytochrome c family protein